MVLLQHICYLLDLTVCTLLVLLFFDVYNTLLFSSNTVNEILELFISNLLGVMMLRLNFLSNNFSFDTLSG